MSLSMLNDIKLIVIDSLSGGNGSNDENSTGQMSDTMKFLAVLAQRSQKPVLLIHHLNKNKDLKDENISRIRGSSAIIQYCRIIWSISSAYGAIDGNRILKVIKSNISTTPDPIGFKCNGEYLEFFELQETKQMLSQIEKAEAAILEYLNPLGIVSSNDIFEYLDGKGISRTTVNRAKSALNIKAFRKGNQWFWCINNDSS
jgi:hypothetical protein